MRWFAVLLIALCMMSAGAEARGYKGYSGYRGYTGYKGYKPYASYGTTNVYGYTKRNGTYVRPYARKAR